MTNDGGRTEPIALPLRACARGVKSMQFTLSLVLIIYFYQYLAISIARKMVTYVCSYWLLLYDLVCICSIWFVPIDFLCDCQFCLFYVVILFYASSRTKLRVRPVDAGPKLPLACFTRAGDEAKLPLALLGWSEGLLLLNFTEKECSQECIIS